MVVFAGSFSPKVRGLGYSRTLILHHKELCNKLSQQNGILSREQILKHKYEITKLCS